MDNNNLLDKTILFKKEIINCEPDFVDFIAQSFYETTVQARCVNWETFKKVNKVGELFFIGGAYGAIKCIAKLLDIKIDESRIKADLFRKMIDNKKDADRIPDVGDNIDG